MKPNDRSNQKLTEWQKKRVNKIYDILADHFRSSIHDVVKRAETILSLEDARLIHLKGTQRESASRIDRIMSLMEKPDLQIPDNFFAGSQTSFQKFRKGVANDQR